MKQILTSVCLSIIIMSSVTGCIGIKKVSNNRYTLDFSKTPYLAYKKWDSNYGEIALMQQRIGAGYALFIENFKQPLKLKTARIKNACIYRLNGFDALTIEGRSSQGTPIHEVISIRKGKATRNVVDTQGSTVSYKVSNDYRSLIQAHIKGHFQLSYYYAFTSYRCDGPKSIKQLNYEDQEFFQNQQINYLPRTKRYINSQSYSPQNHVRKHQPASSYKPLTEVNSELIPDDKIPASPRAEKIHIKID